MNKYLSLILVPLFMLSSQLASADSMTCGTHMIQDDQIPGQSRSDVEGKCGTPESSSGDEVFYKKGNVSYRLHFNDGDKLESITEVVE